MEYKIKMDFNDLLKLNPEQRIVLSKIWNIQRGNEFFMHGTSNTGIVINYDEKLKIIVDEKGDMHHHIETLIPVLTVGMIDSIIYKHYYIVLKEIQRNEWFLILKYKKFEPCESKPNRYYFREKVFHGNNPFDVKFEALKWILKNDYINNENENVEYLR